MSGFTKFWVVLNSDTTNRCTIAFWSRETAEAEAETLGRKQPHHGFYVMESIARCESPDVVWQTPDEDESDG